MDAQELAALEQDLRRDLDAIERVKKMLAFKNGSLKLHGAQKPKPLEEPDEITVEVSEAFNLADIPATSLRGTIEAVMNEDPNVRWTVQKMLAHLQNTGFELKAAKPIYSVGQSMKILANKGKIRLIRRGSGSEPNVYRGKVAEPKEEPSLTA